MSKPFIHCRLLDIRDSESRLLFLEADSAASRRRRIYSCLDSADPNVC